MANAKYQGTVNNQMRFVFISLECGCMDDIIIRNYIPQFSRWANWKRMCERCLVLWCFGVCYLVLCNGMLYKNGSSSLGKIIIAIKRIRVRVHSTYASASDRVWCAEASASPKPNMKRAQEKKTFRFTIDSELFTWKWCYNLATGTVYKIDDVNNQPFEILRQNLKKIWP